MSEEYAIEGIKDTLERTKIRVHETNPTLRLFVYFFICLRYYVLLNGFN